MSEQCDSCSSAGEAVPIALVRHHISTPWRRELENNQFSFCGTPDCPVVYFTEGGESFAASELREPPAYKTGDRSGLLCFCFDVTGDDVAGKLDPTPYIRERVRRQECSCTVLNPSGACCLGSIVRWRKDSA